jgi:hypothetical protein
VVTSIPGFGLCRSIYSVVREAHHNSRRCVVGWIGALVSGGTRVVFARVVMTEDPEICSA